MHDRDKPQIRVPSDDGPNPYDSKTPYPPPGPGQFAGRGFGWWFGVIGLAVLFALVAYFKRI